MPMREVDFILNYVLDNYPKVSDLNVSVGRPFQVEVDGELIPVEFPTPILVLTPFQTETFALQLLNNDRRKLTCSSNRARQTCHTPLGIGRVFASIFSLLVAVIRW